MAVGDKDEHDGYYDELALVEEAKEQSRPNAAVEEQ